MNGTSVHPVSTIEHPLDAVVHVPGSKSIANRAVVCATLAAGASTLRNVPRGDDTAAMLECVSLLGAAVRVDPHDTTIVDVHGVDGALRAGPMVLSAKLAGTTSRFVTALCALGDGHYTVDGLDALRARPMGPLHDALRALGAGVESELPGRLPVTITGVRATRRHVSGEAVVVRMPGDVSSQFITALMLVAPYLPGGLRIELTTPLVSRPYVAITAAVMAAFGVDNVTVAGDHVVVAAGNYRGREYVIEPDASSASYPLAAAAICGGTVRVRDLGPDALQGDARFGDVLAAMGCVVTHDNGDTVVHGRANLDGVTIDMADISDLVPTVAAVAAFASSPTEITGVGFIRNKESDRIGDLAHELRACGVTVTELADGLRIDPGRPHGAAVDTHHDHRLAMAFGIIGLRAHGMRVHDPEVVSKSWPEFWLMLESLGARR